MSTALQIAADAYNDAGTDQTLTSFTMSEWPYSIALNVINTAIGDMNREGSYSFGEASQLLTYTPGNSSYNLNTVASYVIEPRRIMRVRRELTNYAGELKEYNYRDFQRYFRNTSLITQKPVAWSKYSGILYLNSIPDQDYNLTIYYYQQIQPIVVGVNDNQDTIIPEYHEDVLRDLMKAQLLKEMGRPDFSNQYTLAMKKVAELVARSNEDTGIPSVMPRAF